MLLYKAPVPSRHAGIFTAVSASQTRLSSACGLTACQASIFANPVRSLPLASGHARGSTPRWGLWCLQCLQRPHGALAAAQTHFRSPSLLPSIILIHILAYTHSFLTAQFVLLLTAQGFSERWGGWPCSWLALAMLGPAAARPWPQWWLGRSDFARPHVPEWAAESAAKPSCRG